MTDRITEAEIQRIVRETVNEIFTRTGMSANDPLDMQKDFAALRKLRLAQERMTTRAFMTVITVLITGGLALIYTGIFKN